MKTAVCILCGRFGPVTREHAPPQCLFLKPKPTNMITVPTCATCNDKTKLDDEYFRVFVTAGAEPDTKLERLWKEKVINSSLRNSPAMSIMLGKDRDEFVQQNKGARVISTTGRLILEDELHLIQPLNAIRINNVVTKIVRCLHFHERKERLPMNSKFIVTTVPWTNEKCSALRNSSTGRIGIEGEFVYHVQALDSGVFQWLMSFYNKHVFEVAVNIPKIVRCDT